MNVICVFDKKKAQDEGGLEAALIQEDPFLKKLGVKTLSQLGVSSVNDLERKYEVPNDILDTGYYSEVYSLDENVVGKKILTGMNDEVVSGMKAVPYLFNEFEKTKELYEGGVSVPKPEGVFGVYDTDFDEIVPMFAMQDLKDCVSCEKLKGKEFVDAMFLAHNEIKKARGLGYIPCDTTQDNPTNVMWDSKKRKVYLIDFALWYKKEN